MKKTIPIFLLLLTGVFSVNAQTDKITFNNKLDLLKFDKSSPSKVKRLLGSDYKIILEGGGWVTRLDGCFRFKHISLKYEKNGLTFVFSKIRKPYFIPLTFRKLKLREITISDSSNIILNQSIKVNKSSISDIKFIFGEPTSTDTTPINTEGEFEKGTQLEYGYYDLRFSFNENGTLTKIEVLSKKIDRTNKSPF